MLRPRFATAVIGQEQPSGASSDDFEGHANAENLNQKEIEEARQKNKSMLIFGVFTAARGIAILSSGFVTVSLVHEDSTDLKGYGAGAKWRDLMIYTGVTMCAASFGAIGKVVPPNLKIGKSTL